jgi:dynein intermediate chain
MWSPVHPSVFATVNASGLLDVWNLNVDTEIPITTTPVSIPTSHSSDRVLLSGEPQALNKLKWDNEGKRIATGSADGPVFVYDVAEVSPWTCDLA